MAHSTTCLTDVASKHFSSVLAKFSMMTMALAPESFNWCSNSRGVYKGLKFTTTKPARKIPATATGYCGTLGIMIATRSPFASPRLCKYAAKAWLNRSVWAKLMSLPMKL